MEICIFENIVSYLENSNDNRTMQQYGARLAQAMKEKGIDQKTLAEHLSIPRSTVSKLVNGKQFLDFDLAVKACEMLEISLDWLAYGREAPREAAYYKNPERQRIEYLMSILQESDYSAVIVALEGIIEIRMGKKEDGGANNGRGNGLDMKEKGA